MEDKQEKVVFEENDKIIEAYEKIYEGIKSGKITEEEIIELLPFKDSNTFISTTSRFLIDNFNPDTDSDIKYYYPVIMSRFYKMKLNNPQILDNYIKKYIENNDMVPDYSGKRGRL